MCMVWMSKTSGSISVGLSGSLRSQVVVVVSCSASKKIVIHIDFLSRNVIFLHELEWDFVVGNGPVLSGVSSEFVRTTSCGIVKESPPMHYMYIPFDTVSSFRKNSYSNLSFVSVSRSARRKRNSSQLGLVHIHHAQSQHEKKFPHRLSVILVSGVVRHLRFRESAFRFIRPYLVSSAQHQCGTIRGRKRSG